MPRNTLALAKQEKLTQFINETYTASWDQIANAPPGLVIELGVSGGGSFRHICKYFSFTTCYGFDWFYGLPDAWIYQKTGVLETAPKTYVKEGKGAYTTNGALPATLPNGKLIRGLVQDTLKPFLQEQNQDIAFVNFDMDLYSSTIFALQAMDGYFQHGTVLRFDEIAEDAGVEHEERAVREWLYRTRFDIEFMGCDGGGARVLRLVCGD